MLGNQKEPVAAPRDIADHPADPGNVHGKIAGRAVAHYVGHADLAVRTQACRHRPDRRIDADRPRGEVAGMAKRRDQSNRAVAAHTQITHVVEEDDAELAVGAVWMDEQRADEGIRAARFIYDSRTVRIEVLAKSLYALGERTATEGRAAIEHEARGFSARVRIEDAHREHYCGHASRARSIIAITSARRAPDSGSRG